MAESEMTAHSLLHSLVKPESRILSLTSGTTGDPFLDGITLKKLPFLLSARYRVDQADLDGSRYRFRKLVDGLRKTGLRFDLVFVDPYHDYEYSEQTLACALAMATPEATILCHDCLPNPDHTSPTYVPGCWCGVTFAAFRDVALYWQNRSWRVIDADMGIGVIGPWRETPQQPDLSDLDRQWYNADVLGKIELYRQRGRELMRVKSS